MIRARILGEELRMARERAGFTGNELAALLNWSPSKISRVETGERACNKIDVATHLAYCRVSGLELVRILQLASPLDNDYWLQHTGEPIPDGLRSLIKLESTAHAVKVYEPMVIPGLAQTEGYIRALFDATGMIPLDDIEARVRTRLARQRILDSPTAPYFTFYILDRALTMQMGTPALMHEQMLSLLLLGTLPNCRIHVVPDVHMPKMGPGSFNFFTHLDHRPAVSVDLMTSSLILEGDSKVALYRQALVSLSNHALDEEESRSRLADLASQYDREDQDGHGVAQEQR
jgi:transcriptional regulator with XRE-family HTH domain